MENDELQDAAVQLCLDGSQRVVAITGAAGTGKTTIIKQVCDALEARSIHFAVCAPTGKAARRITQATGREAVTIHRLLEYPHPGERDPDTGKPLAPGIPKRGYDRPLEERVVIADEYAMVNQELDRNLVDALGRGARLLVFGDINQLPPIEKNKSLGETPFERHLKRASVVLETVYRQAEGSDVLLNANLIRQGRIPRKSPDFHYALTETPVAQLVSYVAKCFEAGINFGTLDNQIIVPTRKSWVGTVALNTRLRDVLNQDGMAEYSLELPRNNWDKERTLVSVGDKVVCTENTYDMRDYNDRWDSDEDGWGNPKNLIPCPSTMQMLNGETGIIKEIQGDGSLLIEMDDRTVYVPHTFAEWSFKSSTMFPVDPRKRIELAYALTTHKCQGSEFDRVIYVVNKSCGWMLNRNNFYTAVTRARSKVIVLTDEAALRYSLRVQKKD